MVLQPLRHMEAIGKTFRGELATHIVYVDGKMIFFTRKERRDTFGVFVRLVS